MIYHEVVIKNKLGLHARAAAKFVETASRFGSRVEIGHEEKWVDGKSIMSVMLLAAGKGTTLTLRIEGDDKEAALKAICSLIDNLFDEGE